MPDQLTPEQALSILDEAAALAPLTRQQHVLVQQAAQVLATLIRERDAGEPVKQR